jgi:translation initiation factor 3 subunit H
VCIVYDPQKSARGQISVQAIRLKDSFITLFKEGKLTGGQFKVAAAHTVHSL